MNSPFPLDVPTAERFQTPYHSLQEQLWELDETIWKLATRLPDYAPRKRRKQAHAQQPLLFDDFQAGHASLTR